LAIQWLIETFFKGGMFTIKFGLHGGGGSTIILGLQRGSTITLHFPPYFVKLLSQKGGIPIPGTSHLGPPMTCNLPSCEIMSDIDTSLNGVLVRKQN
jgi:hypothetical protein